MATDQILKAIPSLQYGDAAHGNYGSTPAILAKAASKGSANFIVCLFHDVNNQTAANVDAYLNAIDKAVKDNGAMPIYAPLFERPVGN